MKISPIGLILGLCLLAALPARATAPPPLARVGILSPLSLAPVASPAFEAFRKGLRHLGYVEGQDLSFVYRWADGSRVRLDSFVAELVSSKVNLIFSSAGTPTTLAAKKATATIPIVFVGVRDVVGTGIVVSLGHPGGNATGLVNESQDIAGKQLEILKETLPRLSRVGVLWRPSNLSYNSPLNRFDVVVRATGVQADELFIREGRRIVELAAATRMPAIYRLSEQPLADGLLAYGPNIPQMYRRAASYIDKILKEEKPVDLPVEQPAKFELLINLNTAEALGLTIPPDVLIRAGEVNQ